MFAGAVPAAELPAHHAVGDVFAMPCRTRGGGLDVEGLGIVSLEAAASGLPVVVGRLRRRAGDRAATGATGLVVDGRDLAALADGPRRPARRPGPGARGWARPAGTGCVRDWALARPWSAAARRLLGGGPESPGSARPASGQAGCLIPA